MPWGFDIRNPATLVGNILLCRTLIVLNAIRLAGKYQEVPTVRGSHEHPATAYSWHCKEVKLLFSHDRCGTVDVSYCQFGAPYKKNTRLGFVFAEGLLAFKGRICRGGHAHIRLEGALTSKASAYPPGLCKEWVDIICLARTCSQRDDWSEPKEEARPGALEDLYYYNEILESAPWQVIMKEPCGCTSGGRRPHINVSEVRVA